ncbi:MAG TPA: hypothetical protein VH374_07080 [Polyangia bacterium]|nr:hypothetical protein [Polyangia bacterium]
MRRSSVLVAAAVGGALVAPLGKAAAASAVTVEGDSDCPSSAEVEARVASLLAGDAAAGPPSVARIGHTGRELRLRLADDRGVAIAERTLPVTSNCAEMADVVAVTITTWLTQLRPEHLQPLPRLPSSAARPPPVRAPVAFDVGAGIGASVGEGGAAPAAGLIVSLHAGAGGPGVMARASGSTGHDVSIGTDTARWRRWDATVGPSYQFLLGHWRLATGAGFSAGWISVEGQDFPVNQSAGRFSPGVGALVRLDRPFGGWSPWLVVGAAIPLRDEPLTVIGSSDRRVVRPITVDALVGVALGRFP